MPRSPLPLILAPLLGACAAPHDPGDFIAHDDVLVAGNSSALLVPAPGPFENDERPSGSAFRLATFDMVSMLGATVSINDDGELHYDPPPGVLGDDQFQYQLADAAPGSDVARVDVLIRPVRLDLDELLEAGGALRIDGEHDGDMIGTALDSIDDINGDGIRELVIGAPLSDAGGTDAGLAYIVWGREPGDVISLAQEVVAGDGGIVITGPEGYELGWAVSSVGDFDDDGSEDLLIGAPGAPIGTDASAGRGYVWLGGGSTDDRQLLDDSTDPSVNAGALVVIDGLASLGRLGSSVGGGLDINHDGIDDLIIGAPGPSDLATVRAGQVYAVFGGVEGVVDPFAIADGVGGFVIIGIDGETAIGSATAAVGDVNNDGFDDILVGSHRAGGEMKGRGYLVYGKPDNTPVELGTIGASNGFAMASSLRGESFGWSVGSVGDIDADGRDDMVLGALGTRSADGEDDTGAAYLILGKDGTAAINIDRAPDRGEGVVFLGEDSLDQTGYSVAGLGDVNGDGHPDFGVGAPLADAPSSNSGRVYVVLGGPELEGTIALEEIARGNGGFVIEGTRAEEKLGSTVRAAGDMNGDGLADILIGAPGSNAGGVQAGSVYVVFGARTERTE